MSLINSDIKRIAVENPIGIMSTRYRKPDIKIHPYMFGDPYSKNTCLWLKNLKPLHPSKETDDHGEYVVFKSGSKIAKWYHEAFSKTRTPEARRRLRSKTFPGIARAIAEQWTIQIALEEGLLDEKELEILGEDYPTLDINDSEQLKVIEDREQKLIEYWLNKGM